jgi:hypothetical protein
MFTRKLESSFADGAPKGGWATQNDVLIFLIDCAILDTIYIFSKELKEIQ